MNKLILILLPEIESTVKKISRIPDQQNELTQYAVIECYKYEETVKRLHAEGNIGGWIYRTVKHEYVRLKKKEPIDATKDSPDECYADWYDIEKFKPHLTETEWTWLKAYIIDGSYINISSRTGIQPKYVSQRIKIIIKKCKKLKSIVA